MQPLLLALLPLPLLSERYVVNLALDAPSAPPLDSGDSPVALSIGGLPFRCALPSARAAPKAALTFAEAKAAALRGLCLSGQEPEVFTLCLGESFEAGEAAAAREASSEELLKAGGFRQAYSGASGLRATVTCECGLPGLVPEEPKCRRGDMVEASGAMAVVARDEAGEFLPVSWWSGAGEGGSLRRKAVFSMGGLACEAPAAPLPEARLLSAEKGGSSFQVHVAAAPCCSAKALKAEEAGDAEFRKLLAPLAGRCLQVVSGWWTYELCWPWRVRQLHVAVSGDVETPAVVLGHFDKGPLELRKAAESDAVASRTDGRQRELVAGLQGEACAGTVHTWSLARTGAGNISAVGGSFNPTSAGRASGVLRQVESNLDGCAKYTDRFDGAVLLVKRGKCWFHSKALNAQAAGAVGVVVYNDQRHMVDVMEGVDELPPPRIPTLLVERDQGTHLQKALGSEVVLSKVDWDGMDLSRPVSTSVSFHCSPEWSERKELCLPGDLVDVKLVSEEEGAQGEPRFPKSSVRVLKATVVEVFANSSIHVNWQLQGLGEEEEADLPPLVDANATYNGGLRCDGDARAYIERLAEPQACQAEFTVHVAALCAHPKLLPRPPSVQPISCLAEQSPAASAKLVPE